MLRTIEWPTVILGLGIYGAWAAVTFFHDFVPLWLLVPVGGYLVAWHGSLQHEATHGHPSASVRLNALFAGIPLSLWLPFGVYRSLHLAHHRTPELTVPGIDPESFYVESERWRTTSGFGRIIAWITSTLAGRLIVGPALVIGAFLLGELKRVRGGDRSHCRAWVSHVVGVLLVVGWLVWVADFNLVEYAVVFVYPGLSLTLLRSFAEHRPAEDRAHRSAIVEASPLLGLLFLHNNLHALHHEEPSRPWYQLPRRYRELRADLLDRNGGYYFSGYLGIARRYAFRPKDTPVHPGAP